MRFRNLSVYMKLPTAFTSLQIRQVNIMNMLYIIILISLGPC